MYCPNCGKKNRDTAAFCFSCGTKLSPEAASIKNTIVQKPETPEKPKDTTQIELQNGRYILGKKLGAGGMGCVFLATDTRMRCRVVVKEMFNFSVSNEENEYLEKRFQEEARTLFRLKHPYLPKVTDFFSEKNNMYMIMEYVEGENLEKLLENRPDHRITYQEFKTWFGQVLEVISYLHNLEPPVIHRDIKPPNLMLNKKGKVFLVDFGVARSIGEGTHTQTRVGTFGFASPEHYTGKFQLSSDIYSLGATFHFLLTGDDPQERDPFDYPPISNYRTDIPQTVQAIFDKMLSRSRKNRYQNIKELTEDFKKIDLSVFIEDQQATSPTKVRTDKFKKARKTDEMKQAKKTGEMEDESEINTMAVNAANTMVPPVIRVSEEKIQAEEEVIDQTIKVEEVAGEKPVDIIKEEPTSQKTSFNFIPVIIGILAVILAIAGIAYFNNLVSKHRQPVVKNNTTGQPPTSVTQTETPGVSPKPSVTAGSKKSVSDYIAEGKKAVASGEYDSAVAAYGNAIKIDEKSIPAYLGRARAYGKKKEYEKAYEDITKAIEINPDNVDIYLTRGDISDEKGNIGIALGDYDNAVKVDNKNTLAYIKRGKANVKMKFYDKAKKDFDKAIQLEPENGSTYIARGEFYLKNNQATLAKKDFEHALKFRNSLAEAYNGLGNYYIEISDYGTAIEYFDKALKINSEYSEAYNNLGICYFENGKYDLAIKNFTRAIKEREDFSDAYYNRGRCFQEKGEHQQAIKDFNQAVKLTPEDAIVYVYRGQSLYETSETDKALKDYYEAMKLSPDMPEIYNNLGIISFDQNKMNEAISYFSTAIKKKRDYSLAYSNRAEAYFAVKKYADAREDWENVIALSNDTQLVQEAKSRIAELNKSGR